MVKVKVADKLAKTASQIRLSNHEEDDILAKVEVNNVETVILILENLRKIKEIISTRKYLRKKVVRKSFEANVLTPKNL